MRLVTKRLHPSSMPKTGAEPSGNLIRDTSIPTDPFTTLEPQNPPHDVPGLHKIRWSPNFEALLWWKGGSGCHEKASRVSNFPWSDLFLAWFNNKKPGNFMGTILGFHFVCRIFYNSPCAGKRGRRGNTLIFSLLNPFNGSTTLLPLSCADRSSLSPFPSSHLFSLYPSLKHTISTNPRFFLVFFPIIYIILCWVCFYFFYLFLLFFFFLPACCFFPTYIARNHPYLP